MWVAAAVVGAAVVGYVASDKAAGAAEDAANTQAASADAATQVQWNMYNQSRDDYAPFQDVGLDSLQQLRKAAGVNSTFDQAGYDAAVQAAADAEPQEDGTNVATPNRNDFYTTDRTFDQAGYDKALRSAVTSAYQNNLGRAPEEAGLAYWTQGNNYNPEAFKAAATPETGDTPFIGTNVAAPNRDDFYTPDPFRAENQMIGDLTANKYGYGSQTLAKLGDLGNQTIDPNVNVDLSGQRAITGQVGSMNTNAAQDLSGQRNLTGKLGDINPLAAQNYDRAQGFIGKAEALNPNITFDENSPYFQASKSELMRTLNNRMSAQGLSGSSTSEDAIIRNILPLIEQEYGRQEGNYTRSLGQYGQLYGMETGLGGIRYGETAGDITRQAGLLGQQYTQTSGTDQMGYTQDAGDIERDLSRKNQQFGMQSSTDNTQYTMAAANYARQAAEAQRQIGNATTLYGAQQGYDQDAFNRGVQGVNLTNQVNQQGYNRLVDLAKIGSGAAGAAGSAALQTGQNVGNIQQASGAAIAQGQLASGQQQASTLANIGALPLQAYNQYQLVNALKQPTTTPTTGTWT